MRSFYTRAAKVFRMSSIIKLTSKYWKFLLLITWTHIRISSGTDFKTEFENQLIHAVTIFIYKIMFRGRFYDSTPFTAVSASQFTGID